MNSFKEHCGVEDFWKPSHNVHEMWQLGWGGDNGDDPMVCLRCGETTHTISQCMRYKTRRCKYHSNGYCALSMTGFGSNHCLFAHGALELREPWLKRCVRVHIDEVSKKVTLLGCQKTGHVYRHCPDTDAGVNPAEEPRQCSPRDRLQTFRSVRFGKLDAGSGHGSWRTSPLLSPHPTASDDINKNKS